MKKKAIITVTILTSLALIGLIATQLVWVSRALELAEKQYDHRVTVALQNVERDMERLREQHDKHKKDSVCTYCKYRSKCGTIPDTLLVDSLIKTHFEYQQLDRCYEYALIKADNDTVVYKDNSILSDPISLAKHKTCIACLSEYNDYTLEVYFPAKKRYLMLDMFFWLAASVIFLLTIIGGFFFVIIGIFRQKRLSDMRNDFMNNMTHELKTPISTISLASEVLLKADKASSAERLSRYSEIIFDETNRLRRLVDRVLQAATMEKVSFKFKIQEIDIHGLIQNTVNNLCLEACEKPVDISLNFNAETHLLMLDKVHVTNIISNLVENAIKYSGDKPALRIETKSGEGVFNMSFADNGCGMGSDAQGRIFDKFYRVPKGNLHDVKGYGLGLYYVRTVLNAIGGSISVKSEQGKGSTFFVSLPIIIE